MFTLNDIQNKADELERANELSKTKGGREILKNIVKANLKRLIDRTAMYSSQAELDKFSKIYLKDIVRPNKFQIEFGLKNKNQTLINFHSTYLCKSFTIPTMTKNKIEMKRAGKTIKIPLNMDMSESIEMAFYQDIGNTVLTNIVTLLNMNEFQYDNQIIQKDQMYFYLKFQYIVDMNFSESNSGTSVLNAIADFFDVGLFDSYENAGKKKHIKKTLTKNVKDVLFEFTFNNISINSFSGLEFDMERLETFNELKLSIDYNGVEFKTWSLEDMKLRESQKGDNDDTNIVTKNSVYHKDFNSSIDKDNMMLI